MRSKINHTYEINKDLKRKARRQKISQINKQQSRRKTLKLKPRMAILAAPGGRRERTQFINN